MNVLMTTNTYTPFIGGVARSVDACAGELRQMGHRVVIVAPDFQDMPQSEDDVIRVPALQNFNGSDFSVVIPIPGLLSVKLEDFNPDIVHSHHPYLLGGTAVRVARRFECPLVFTYHTMYEHYLHYVPAHARKLQQFVTRLVTGYCNLCNHVVAPSESVAEIIRGRGVETPVDVVPTGVYTAQFARGSGLDFRQAHAIPKTALVAGYVGRLAPEKNLVFLAEAVRRFALDCPQGHVLVVGSGPSRGDVQHIFDEAGLTDRLHLAGSLEGQKLIDAYHAMDVFVFASQTETQGMVLTEAMAAGKPVVAVDAPGVREVVTDGVNGCLLGEEDHQAFADAMRAVATATSARREAFQQAARETARQFSMQNTAQKLVGVYERAIAEEPGSPHNETAWDHAVEEVKTEWNLIKNIAEAATDTLKG